MRRSFCGVGTFGFGGSGAWGHLSARQWLLRVLGGRRGMESPFHPPSTFTRSAMRMVGWRLGATETESL